jgi:phosphotransferase system enzyme I (PtsI)
MKERYDSCHPAILRMIRMVVEAGHKEGCRICICGEIAADTSMTGELLRMGVDSLSVVPSRILPVRRAIMETDLSEPDDKNDEAHRTAHDSEKET